MVAAIGCCLQGTIQQRRSLSEIAALAQQRCVVAVQGMQAARIMPVEVPGEHLHTGQDFGCYAEIALGECGDGQLMRALRSVGVPYTDGEIETAVAEMTRQAHAIAAEVEAQQGPTGLADKEVIAVTAYLQRLGTDIRWKRPEASQPLSVTSTAKPAAPASGGGK